MEGEGHIYMYIDEDMHTIVLYDLCHILVYREMLAGCGT